MTIEEKWTSHREQQAEYMERGTSLISECCGVIAEAGGCDKCPLAEIGYCVDLCGIGDLASLSKDMYLAFFDFAHDVEAILEQGRMEYRKQQEENERYWQEYNESHMREEAWL